MTSSLIISHLPTVLREDECGDLLSYFGAEEVKVFKRCRRKKAIYARFQSISAARHALQQLHQVCLGGSRLVVEYADGDVQLRARRQRSVSPSPETGPAADSPHRLADFPFPSPSLRYAYPPPSVAILARINAALVSTPRFYTQVLHLMNKLSLAAPFPASAAAAGEHRLPVPRREEVPATATVEEDVRTPAEPASRDVAVQTERAADSTSESELQSDEASVEPRSRPKRRRPGRLPDGGRRLRASRRLQEAAVCAATAAAAAATPRPTLSEVFDAPCVVAPARGPVLKLPTDASAANDGAPPAADEPAVQLGFAKLYPSRTRPDADPPPTDTNENGDFITSEQLAQNRISAEDMKRLAVFARYSRGDVSARLYIKNLDKRVVTADLRRIFGRYIDHHDDEQNNAFDVRLMQEGRMKGQAFISLPSPAAAERALAATNGFILRDKPMVVQFARSAQPRPTDA